MKSKVVIGLWPLSGDFGEITTSQFEETTNFIIDSGINNFDVASINEIKLINKIATRGEKSNIPVFGSKFLIGDKRGSVIEYKIFNTGKNKLPGTTVNQEERTLSKIAM